MASEPRPVEDHAPSDEPKRAQGTPAYTRAHVITALVTLFVGIVVVHTVPFQVLRTIGLGVALFFLLCLACAAAAPIVGTLWGIVWLARRRWLVLVAMLLTVGWGALWHTKLGPHPQNIARVDRLHTAIEAHIAGGNNPPRPEDLIEALVIEGADPHNLRPFYDSARRAIIDAYNRPIAYRRGIRGNYQVASRGRDGLRSHPDDGDDVVRGTPNLIDLSIEIDTEGLRDATVDTLRGLFSRDEDEDDEEATDR